MKKIFVFLFLCLICNFINAQSNTIYGSGINYTNGVPTGTVTKTTYAQVAIDTATKLIYRWNNLTSSWNRLGFGVDTIQSTGSPSYTPTGTRSPIVINADYEMYIYDSGMWNQIAGGGGGSDTQDLTATAGKGTLRLVNGGYVILNDSSATNEIQTIDTFGIVSNILMLSLLNDDEAYKQVDLSPYLDNTDAQAITITAGKGTIRLVDGGSVVLADSTISNEGVLALNTESSSLYSVISNSLGSATIYFKEGTGIDITRSGDTLSINSSVSDTDDQTLSWNGSTGEITISEGNTIDIDGRYLQSEVDGSTTNEAFTIDADDSDTEVISNQTLKFEGAGIISTDYVPGTDKLIITGTEVDGSTSNEIQSLTATAGKGTLRLDLGGGSVVLNDSSATNEIQTISILAGGGTINLSQSGGSITLNDSSRTNEIQYPDTFFIAGNYLKFSLINDGRLLDSVSLASYLDNTDSQTLDVFSTSGNTISASLSGDGESTKTASIINSNALSISGNVITGSVNGQSDTVLVIATNVLAIGSNLLTSTINGQVSNSVSLAAYLDNTDSQSFSGSDDGTTFTLDLSGAATDISFKEGSNITITRTGTELTFAGSAAYTTEEAQDAIGAMINASLQYVDGTPLLAINDRDFGDLTTSGSGLTWTIDNGVINAAKLGDSAVTAVKIISNAVTTTALATNSVTNVKINDVAWSKITGTPTTLSGYGITDALSNSTTSTQDGYFGDIYLKDDTSPSHYLQITNAENLTGSNKTLSIVTGNSNRTLTFSGDATISGTNTGDQTITLTGDVTGSGTGSFAATIADNSVDGTDIALGSDAQGDIMYYDGTNWVRLAAGTNGHFLKTQGAGANPTWAATAGGTDGNGIYTGDGTVPDGTYAHVGTSMANPDFFALGHFEDFTTVSFDAHERGFLLDDGGYTYLMGADSATSSLSYIRLKDWMALYTSNVANTEYAYLQLERSSSGLTVDNGSNSSEINIQPDSARIVSDKFRVNVDSLHFKIGGSHGTNGQVLTSNGYSATWQNASGGYTDEQAQDAIGAMVNSSLTYTDGTPLLAIASRDFGDWTTSSNGTVATIDNGVITAAKLGDSAVTAVKIISNAVTTTALATNSVTNAKINDVAWSKITGTPTTLSGYGITDALSNSTSSTQDGYFGDIYLKDDTSPSHYLQITNAENLSGSNKVLSIVTGNSNRTLTFSGDATISGTNTGDQTITLTGDVTGSGTGSFAATIADNSVDGTDIAFGSDAQGDVYYYDGTNVVRLPAGTSGYFLKTNGAGANPEWAAGGGGSDGNGIYSGSGTVPDNTYSHVGTSIANPTDYFLGHFEDQPTISFDAHERGFALDNAGYTYLFGADSVNSVYSYTRLKDAIYSKVSNTAGTIKSEIDEQKNYLELKSTVSGEITSARLNGDSIYILSDQFRVNADTVTFKINGSHGTNGQVLASDGYLTKWTTVATLSDGDKGDISLSSSATQWDIDADAITANEIAAGAVGTSEIATNAVANSDFRQSAGYSVVGRATSSTGDVADITAGSDNYVLRRSGTSLGFGTVATGGIADSAITGVKIISNAVGTTALASGSVTTLKIADNAVTGGKIALGSDAQGDIMYYNGTDYVRLAAGTSGQYLQTQGAGANPQWAAVTGVTDGDKTDITVSGSGATWTIDNDVVTFAKMQNVAANSFLANTSGSSGDVAELALSASQLAGRGSTGNLAAITIGSGLSMSGTTLSATGSGGDIINGGNTTGATVVIGTNDNNGLNFEIQDTAALSFSTGQVATFTMSTSTTNALVDQVYIDTKTYNTAAAGFGGSLMFKGESTTTESQAMATIGSYWTTATHASREAALTFQLGDNASSLAEVLKISRTDLNGYGQITLGTTTPLEITTDKLYQAGGNYTIDVGTSGTITHNGITKFENQLNVIEQSAPSTPASGRGYIYAKTDNLLYFKNDAGTEYDLTATGTGLSDGDKGDIDVTSSGSVWTIDSSSVTTLKILDNTVANADLRQSAGLSVVGRASNSTGNVADITAGSDLDVLYRDGSTLVWGKLYGASIQTNEVSLTKLQQLSANTVLGNATGASGNVSEIALSASNLLGRGSSGNIAAITAGQGIAFTGTVLSGGVYAGSGNISDNTKAQVLRTNDFAIGYFQNYPTSVNDEDRGIWMDDEVYIYANDSTSGDFSRMYSDNGSWTTKSSNGSTESYVQNSKNYTQTYASDGTDQSLFKVGSDSIYTYSDRYRFETDSFKVVLSGSAGTNGQVLKSNGSVLYWAADNAGGGLSDADYGDIVVTSSGTVWTIDANAVTSSKIGANEVADADIRQSAGLSILGRSANSTGNIADITAGSDNQVLRRSGTSIGFGTVATGGIADSAITEVKLISNSVGTTALATGAVTTLKIASNSVDGTKIALGSDAQGDVMYYNGTDWARLAPGTSGQFLKTNGAASNPAWADAGASVSDGDKGDITVTSSGATWTIDNGVITSARIADNTITSSDVDDNYIILQGGNTIGETVVIGSNDANAFSIESNNVVRATVTGGASTGGAWTMTDVTSKTNTIEDVLTLTSNSTGTAAANFGTGILLNGESSTTNSQEMARIRTYWTTETHSNREAALSFMVGNNGGALSEILKIDRTDISGAGQLTFGSSGQLVITPGLLTNTADGFAIDGGSNYISLLSQAYFQNAAHMHEITTPTNIGSGYGVYWLNSSDSKLHFKSDAGTDYDLTKSNVISPSQITGDQDNYNPTGLSTASVVRVSGDAQMRAITSIAAGYDGQRITWRNVGSYGIYFPAEHPDGTAANRIAGGQDTWLWPNTSLVTVYDATSSRWFIEGAENNMQQPPRGQYKLYMPTGGTSEDNVTGYTTRSGTTSSASPTAYAGSGIGGASSSSAGGTAFYNFTQNQLDKIDTAAISCMVQFSLPTDTSTSSQRFILYFDNTTNSGNSSEGGNNTFGMMQCDSLNSGKWLGFVVSSGGTRTTQDLGVRPTAGKLYKLKYEIDNANSEVRYYIDDVYVGRIMPGNNTPAAGSNICPRFMLRKTAGSTARDFMIHAAEVRSIRN